MEKLNLLELLKDCPKGTKLYSPLVGECTLEHIHSELKKILISTSDGTTLTFNYNGTYFQMDNSECLLFPSKDQRDWSKFQRPFKDGDVVFYSNTIAIFKEWGDETLFRTYCTFYPTVSNPTYQFEIGRPLFGKGIRREVRFATEEEKQKLFDAIKANGYKWNEKTKTLEELVEPKFKVGDRIKEKQSNIIGEIIDVQKNKYNVRIDDKGLYLYFREQDNWELGPNKFDISTLVPLESKVLVRNVGVWLPAFWGYYSKEYKYPFVVDGGNTFAQCIPYEGNEHLLGTANDCDEYYKTW